MDLNALVSYFNTEHKALGEQLRADAKHMGPVAEAVVSTFRTTLHSGFTWLIQFAEHQDSPAVRNMRLAHASVNGAFQVTETFFKANPGPNMPQSLRDIYTAYLERFEQAQLVAEEKHLWA
ncbi:hypothetical protein RYA05_03490 [Pseudomonas syringae pv. actinidiae]|nr:hypothetical protein [Pseudomonas syringae pv. actinidiae]